MASGIGGADMIDELYAPYDDLSRIYITKVYKCGHDMLDNILRVHATQRQLDGEDRRVWAKEEKCHFCDPVKYAVLVDRHERRIGEY
jgi:hypothetical protein